MVKLGPIEKLGTIWWFELFALQENTQEEINLRLTGVMTNFEEEYSRFKTKSAVGRLNNGEVISEPTSELRDMLSIAAQAHTETKGVFNIAVGDYLEKSGYDKSYSFQSQELPSVYEKNIAQELLKQTEIKLPEGIKIDFGGFGKGYLIDKLATVLKEEFGLEYFLINGGGDMYVTSENTEAITIGLSHPTKPGEYVGRLALLNQGFASSSPFVRAWQDQHGNSHNHLVGKGEDSVEKQAVFVTAPRAVTADIWATSLAINQALVVPKEVTQIKT